MENAIKEKCPFKIDIGPVYSVDVKISLFAFPLYFKIFSHGKIDD